MKKLFVLVLMIPLFLVLAGAILFAKLMDWLDRGAFPRS